MDFSEFKRAVDGALYDAVIDMAGQIKDHLVPRSENQPTPKDPSVPTTGNLRDAISREKSWEMRYRIGVDATRGTRKYKINWREIKRPKPVSYGEHLEFGTRYMEPRSFLRRGVIEFKERFFQVFKKGFRDRFWKKK